MDASTQHSDWRTVLKDQGRRLSWLADQTGWSRRTVYAYSRGDLVPTDKFLEAAARVLGQPVTA